MTATRQDAWTEDEDLLLAEVVLRHVREGSTQLAAFEEIGIKLNRTAAACGFRWNSLIRKKYEAAIQIAKAQRQKRKYNRPVVTNQHKTEFSEEFGEPQDIVQTQDETLSFDNVIKFLKQQKQITTEAIRQYKLLEKQLEEKNSELAELRKENKEMKQRLSYMESDYKVVNEDYKALVQIIDRARKLALTEEVETVKPIFKMDSNGNLERIDKLKVETE